MVLMGVCGCGKTTIGRSLATATGLEYLDGDNLHPVSNVEKMRAGRPLDDADRAPWLEACGRALAAQPTGLVLGCSALRREYRDIIRAEAAPLLPFFVHLDGARELLLQRLSTRRGHFMPISLLDSQLETLEPPCARESAMTVDIAQPIAALVARITSEMAEGRASRAAIG